MSKPIKHIGVLRLSAMGDVAMTVPVLRAFVLQNPEIKVTVISVLFFKPFFDTIPNVSFFVFDKKGRHKGFVGLLRLFTDLKKLNIDAFADLHNVLRSKVVRTLFALSGTKVAFVNKGRAGKAALTRSENKIFEQLPTMFERHTDVFEELGFVIDLSHPTFPSKAGLDAEMVHLIGNKNQKWIGIAPFAQYNSKMYPLDLMREVINKLTENKEYKILLFGGGTKEIELLNSISNQRQNVVTIAGKLKLQQELQLISNLDVMLSMDSGNAHIAAMLGVNVITLWGATHPYAGFSPFNQPMENALVQTEICFLSCPPQFMEIKKLQVMKTLCVPLLLIKLFPKFRSS